MSKIEKTNWHIVQREPLEGHAKIVSPVRYTCEKCKDQGYLRRSDVPVGHPEFGKSIKCTCKEAKDKEKQQQELLFASGILDMFRFKNASFETFENITGTREAYKKALQFAQNSQGWLVLVGPYGCGKTHLAAAIAKQCIAQGMTVLIQTVPDLLDYLRSTFSPATGQSYAERFEAMRNAELLILDDYGAQNDTDWTTEKIFQLLNYRYNMGLATVITSNNMQLAGIDPRIYSRLHDTSISCLVKMENAQDYRMRGRS